MFKYVAQIRPDYKTLSTFLIRRLQPLANYMFPINPFGARKGSMGGIKMALSHLREGHPLGIFPAGEVSSYNKENPEIRYLQGTVSISNNYSEYSKHLMVQYFKKYHFDNKLSHWATSKTPLAFNHSTFKEELILKQTKDLQSLSRLICSIDTLHAPIPVLIRKYIMLGGKFIGFNVDPEFNYCLDGFIIID